MNDSTFRTGLYIQRTEGIEAYWQWLQVKAIEHKFSGGYDENKRNDWKFGSGIDESAKQLAFDW